MERITPPESYYNYFNNKKKPKFEIADSLQVYLENDPMLKDEIAGKKSITLILLGSATHRNPLNLAEFLKKLRPNNYNNDKIVIEEISGTAVQLHKENYKPDDKIPVYMTKMDMTEMGLKPESADILISDFTVNFISSIEDIDRFFKEIRRVLKDNGVALISLTSNKNYMDQEKHGYYQEKITSKQHKAFSVYNGLGIKQLMFTLPQYIEIAKSNGLSIEILDRKDNEKMGPQFFLKIRKEKSK